MAKIEEEKKLAEAKQLTETVKTFIFGNSLNEKLTPEQIDMCIQTAVNFGMNPLKREIHFIPRFNSQSQKYDVNVVVGYENYIKRAPAALLNGWSVTFEGTGPAMKAILTIFRKDWREPFVHEVYLQEAQQNTPVWNKMPRFMLRKTAISQGFRLCFPEELAGMPYTPEELGLGIIDDGKLIEDKKPEPKKASEAKLKIMTDLFFLKGKSPKVVMEHFKIGKIEDMTDTQADAVISKLNSFPDKDDQPVPEMSEDVDPEEAAKAIDELKAHEGGEKHE